jgi:hypothetical protein
MAPGKDAPALLAFLASETAMELAPADQEVSNVSTVEVRAVGKSSAGR